jgi:uncharacterized damage-inducible protein DinB
LWKNWLQCLKPEDIEYRPCGDQKSYSLGELVSHMYEMIFAYSKAVEKGSLENEDFQQIPSPEKNPTLENIKGYMQNVKNHFTNVLKNLTSEQLEEQVKFTCWHGFKLSGMQALMTIQEEVVHHRGQLTLYLRLLGYELPIGFIYDYS